MNELILSAFMTFISGKQDVPLNSECSVVLEKEKLSGTKELSQNGNTVVAMNKKLNTARMYFCAGEQKKVTVWALNLTKENALNMYETLYKAIVIQHGKPERDSKTFKNTILGLIAEFKGDLKFAPYAQWDILPKNNGSLITSDSTDEKWSISYTIEVNKQVNCGDFFEFKKCPSN